MKESSQTPKFLFAYSFRKAAKKFFFSSPATEALIPPPSSLVAKFLFGLFFRASRKFFLLSGPAFTPPLS